MTRVVHLLPGLGVGGAERALERLLNGGLTQAFDNHVVSLGGDGPMRSSLEGASAPVHLLQPGARWRLPLALHAKLGHLRPDVIQAWMYHANVAASLLARSATRGDALFWNIRQSLSAPTRDKLTTRAIIRGSALLARSPRAIIYNSQLARDQHEAIGYPAHKGIVIHNGFVAAQTESLAEVAGKLRRALDIAPEALVVAHIGRYHPVKDHGTMIEAAVRVARENIHIHFVFAGLGVTYANDAFAKAVPCDLRARFHLLGERGDVPTILAASDIFALSSVAEGFPNVVAEAMIAGCACVSTDVGEVATILDGCGRIVPPGDPSSLADAIETYARNAQSRRHDGARVRERIALKYSLEAAVSQYKALYEGAAARNGNYR